jgi:prepilin-type N-terminal cleavage/methylation domain-containing protein
MIINSNFTKKGLTLIELVLVCAIIGIIATLSLRSFMSFNISQALDKDVKNITAALDEARSNTLASQGNSQYGVHFETGKVVLFKGGTYSSVSPDNRIIGLSGQTQINSIVLSGGSNHVVFERLTGKPNVTGNVVIQTKRNAAQTKTITIYATGISDSN